MSVLAAGCGGSDGGERARPTTNAAPPAESARGERGRQLVTQSGCFACHRIGRAGSDGPGPELTSVGKRLPASVIARTLVAPKRPMPSFRDLPAEDRRAIVEYLTTLRGG